MKTQSTFLRRTAGLLLLAGLSSLALVSARPVEETVKEPESGIHFATVLVGKDLAKDFKRPGGDVAAQFADQMLTGVGCREKTIFAVNVYAMGIYVEPKKAGAKLGKWRGKSAKELRKDSSFYDALLAESFPTTLRLVMCRDVDGDDMAEAFEDSLAPRMKKILAKDAKLGSLEDLKRFRGFFDINEVKEGVELLFTWDTDGTLYTRMEGKPLGAIPSPALSRALFDIYLGSKPISKGGKKSLVARLPGVLDSTKSDE